MSYCTVIFGAQALFLFFYTMAGLWKVSSGVADLFHGTPGSFSPNRLSWTLADRIMQTGTEPALADLVIRNVWLGWPMFLFVMYVQFVAVVVVLRPRIHVLWGYLIIAFHAGTWILMEIIFVEHVLLLILFLVLSPFRVTGDLRSTVRDVPMFGPLIAGLLPRSLRGEPHERPAH